MKIEEDRLFRSCGWAKGNKNKGGEIESSLGLASS